MMLAAVCEALIGEDGVHVREMPSPLLSANGVRVAVRSGSVNYPDGLMVRGLYQDKREPPFVVGADCAGVVVEVGDEVEEFAVGDRVHGVSYGAFATEAVLSTQAHLHHMPDEMSFDHGAAFNMTYGTSYHGLVRRGQLQAGESVLVLGAAGGCGSAAVQIAKALGAKVIGVAGGAEKCAMVAGLGADVVIDHSERAYAEAVREVTDGRGVDVVFDPVGSADGREQLRSLAWGGRYVVVGFASGNIPVVSLNHTILKNVSILGYAWGLAAARDPEGNRRDYEQLFAWYRQGSMTPVISHSFPLSEVADAIRVVYERRVVGKVVIEMPA